jgi:mono/diheme cytochrome c family protein
MCLVGLLGACLAGFSIGLSRAAEAGPATAPTNSPASVPRPSPVPIPAVQPAPGATVDNFLKWDADTKQVTVPNGTAEAHFTFYLTNVSPETVTILGASGTCFCTVAKLPDLPWKIAPGAGGEINVTMDVRSKSGTIPKGVTVSTDKGVKSLSVSTTILPPAAPTTMNAAERESNQKLAVADRQAVFKGECASCHAEPAKNKMGKELFTSVCGVCHEAEHRATMVPNLHTITQETNPEFWRNWITHGKPGSLMPAFAETEGGVLSEVQITSLVRYLLVAMPSKPATPAAPAATKTTPPPVN